MRFHRSTDVDRPLRVKLGYLERQRESLPLSAVIEDAALSLSMLGSRSPVTLAIEACVVSGAKPISQEIWAPQRLPESIPKWNEWIELPIAVKDLPLDASLCLTVWGPSGGPDLQVYGGTTLPLFDESDNTLRQGRQKLKLWLDQKADGLPETITPAIGSATAMDRLELLMKRHQTGHIQALDWLDNLAFRKIEKINNEWLARGANDHYLFIELPIYDADMVFGDHYYKRDLDPVPTFQLPAPVTVFGDDEPQSIMIVYDPEFSKESPIQVKHRRLVRSAAHDRDLRPTPQIRDELAAIMNFSPVRELTNDEKNLIWRFRHHLTRHPAALSKFVRSVTWDDSSEAEEAVEVLHMWSTIDVADALGLLGPSVTNAKVRAYAVDKLRTASDLDLKLYLLQLVEALKFEPWTVSPAKSYLARFLINRAILNPILGNFFYWYLSVQSAERRYGTQIYQPVLRQYLTALPGVPGGEVQKMQIKFQVKFVNKLLELAKFVKQNKESRPRKIEQLRDYVSDPRNELVSFLPTVLPLDPTVVIVGCVPEECTVFKSSMQPLKIVLKTQGGGTYPIIFKSGDDLRQDQLVIQIIQLMDQLLRNENLDLKLTPYSVLATSPSDGAVQFVPNETVAHVIGEYHGILPFLRQFNADPQAPYGVKEEAMDTYVRSCAGYAVITYLLGVGDRHLENLLMTFDGRFLHIDFGYILGQDPKPFPPMIKLPIQLIDGMGGINSDNYVKFCSYCFTAFTTLRRSSNLILALFGLMTESSIPNIMTERGQAVHKVEERFCLNMSEQEAILRFQNLINDSVNAFLPMVIDRLHSLAQYWRA